MSRDALLSVVATGTVMLGFLSGAIPVAEATYLTVVVVALYMIQTRNGGVGA